MWVSEQTYQDYLDGSGGRLQGLRAVRTLGAWRVESAADTDGGPLLLLVNAEAGEVVRCHYPSFFARAVDIALVRRLPPGDAAPPLGR